ncbi:MAG: DUF4203 domain-containing protein [Anaerolineae bacterium]|nr:DUF4203 domain-containing protein [Anaerolineae bacterium]
MVNDFLASNLGTQILTIVLGVVVLILGRKLFWLAIAVLGFVLGLGLGMQFAGGQPDWLALIIGLVVGGLGALLAVLAQKIAVGVGGFILGGYLVMWLINLLGLAWNQWFWVLFFVGGVIVAVLVLLLFDMALIIVSSLIGAALIVQAVNLNPLVTGFVFFALLIVGIAAQTKMLSPTRETD